MLAEKLTTILGLKVGKILSFLLFLFCSLLLSQNSAIDSQFTIAQFPKSDGCPQVVEIKKKKQGKETDFGKNIIKDLASFYFRFIVQNL